MKTEAGDVPLIAVGGGAFLIPDKLPGVSQVNADAHGNAEIALSNSYGPSYWCSERGGEWRVLAWA
jgi:hypothetical protein